MSKQRNDYPNGVSLRGAMIDLPPPVTERKLLLTVNGYNIPVDAVEWHEQGGTLRLVSNTNVPEDET